MTYDPEYNRVYIGTGNGGPWNRKLRSPGGGDNLFLCSVVALDADTGQYIWHYQTTPGESWDFTSTMDLVLANIAIDGKPRKVHPACAQERLLLCHRPRDRQADIGGEVRQGDLGRGDRHGDRPPH